MSNTIHTQYITHTRSIYAGMVRRFAEFRDKRGRVRRLARQIPFTLEQFRAWVLEQFGGEEHGVIRCPYGCGELLTTANFVTDHKRPVSRGGELYFDNLICCCERCNDVKGAMTYESYIAFRRGLETFPEGCRNSILERLEKFVKLAAKDRRNTQRFLKQQSANNKEQLHV